MVGQSEVIIRAKIQQPLRTTQSNMRILRRFNLPLRLPESLRTDVVQLSCQMLAKTAVHDSFSLKDSLVAKELRSLTGPSSSE